MRDLAPESANPQPSWAGICEFCYCRGPRNLPEPGATQAMGSEDSQGVGGLNSHCGDVVCNITT